MGPESLSPRAAPAALVALALLAVSGCAGPGGAGVSPPPAATGPTDRPVPLVVAVVVDQLPAWLAEERWPLLGGGFGRLLREGTWVRELTYLHATTETAPGHAALFTGIPPRESGITVNAVHAPAGGGAGQPRSAVEDPAHRLIGPAGPTSGAGVSLHRLRVPTLADALRARDPRAVVVALSLKDRGAVFGGGRHPDASLWFDPASGSFVTSDAFAPSFPGWAASRAHPVPPGAVTWTPLDPAFLARHAAVPDDQPGESALFAGRAFPHPLPPPGPERARAFRATPLGDEALLDLALEAVRAARRPDHPMLLTVSLSASDYVGHLFGPDSWEAWDALLRLDAALGRFLEGLDAAVGSDGYAVVLSSDHGVVSSPEAQAAFDRPWCPADDDRYERPCRPGRRLDARAVRQALAAGVATTAGPGGAAIDDLVDGHLYLSPEARALPAPARAALDRAVGARAAEIPGIAAAVPLPPVGAPCPPPADESWAALACRSADDAAYLLVPERGSFFSGGAAGTTHGTPYRYDRTVPLLVRHPRGRRGAVVERTGFGSFRATAWWALTGERTTTPYGEVIGAAP